MDCGIWDFHIIGAASVIYECMATLFTSALLLAVVFSSSVFVLIRCALRTINIPAKICFIYDRTHFFFSAIILGMAFNVLPSDVLVLVWDWMVDKIKDGASINVVNLLFYVYSSASQFVLVLFLKSVLLFPSWYCWRPLYFRSWICEGFRCCFYRHMHLHSRQRPSFGLQGGARNDNSTFEAEVAALRKKCCVKEI